MKCFYHMDMDGKCSAHIVNKFCNIENKEFIPINYGMRFPIEKIREDEKVYIVDFSISPDNMRELLKITRNVIWIDHHKTAIDKYKDFEYDIKGIRLDGVAACILTYQYCSTIQKLYGTSDINIPEYVKLIADWDLWKFKYGDRTKYFQYGINSMYNEPTDELWNDLELFGDKYINDIVENGKAIERYKKSWSNNYINSFGYEVMFEGYNCFVVNAGLFGSDSYESIEKSYDIYISYVFNGEFYKYSLRTKNNIDVSEIAKKYGGGGHKQAAGFESPNLLFYKNTI